jgi:hypothetical protein
MIRAVSIERYQKSGTKRAVSIGPRYQLSGIKRAVSKERYQKSGTNRPHTIEKVGHNFYFSFKNKVVINFPTKFLQLF